MTRVLLVCPEPLGHGQPAGIGIRFLEMTRVLLADGHRVTVMSLDAGHVPGATAVPLVPEAIAHETTQTDVTVVQGHAANDLFAHAAPGPTVVDLYDPYIVENLHYHAQRGSEVFTHDHATLIRSVLQGDFFLCASEAQRMFYLGVLLATGRLNPVAFESDPRFEGLIAIAPFGVQPPRQRREAPAPAILFGGIYDWYEKHRPRRFSSGESMTGTIPSSPLTRWRLPDNRSLRYPLPSQHIPTPTSPRRAKPLRP
jgi:hypothetical protein